jgi:hypothetical protein
MDEEEYIPPGVQLLRTKDYMNVSHIAECDHLADDNWHEWNEQMDRVFKLCHITEYMKGTIEKPSLHNDPEGAVNWNINDAWAQQVIISNVTSSQMNHIGSKNTAEEMYSVLSDTHDNKAHTTVTQIQTLLYETKASESDNILKHLDTLKSYWDWMNKFPKKEFHVYDTHFKSIISGSLPKSWQLFVDPYNGNANDLNDKDLKRTMSSDAFIGLIQEEYRIRLN